jgi:hypothetical protein
MTAGGSRAGASVGSERFALSDLTHTGPIWFETIAGRRNDDVESREAKDPLHLERSSAEPRTELPLNGSRAHPA